MRYGTSIEMRLPANWNRRLLFQGGGGLDGVLLPALGNVSRIHLRAGARLCRGLNRQRTSRSQLH